VIALGVDPDTFNTGLALVEAPRTLLWVGVAQVPRTLPVEKRIIQMASAIEGVFALELAEADVPIARICVEGQKHYPRSRTRPNDLIHLAQVAGAALSPAVFRWPSADAWVPYPQDWKGTVKKEVMHRRIMSKVHNSTDRLAGVKPSHRSHVIDAIGLALWALKQPQPRHVK